MALKRNPDLEEVVDQSISGQKAKQLFFERHSNQKEGEEGTDNLLH
jgi:hypothetical protein